MLRTCELVSRQCRLWSFFQCALDLRGSVRFFRVEFWGWVDDVIQFNVRSGSRWACLFYVHEHERLGFGMLSVETAVLNPFDCICGFSSRQKRSVVYGRILTAVFGISGRVLWRKDPAFALKPYKSMWQYLARNLKADVNFFNSPIKLVSLRKLAPSRNAVFNHQTGMDFVTEISFCKTSVVDEKSLVFRGWESAGKSFKVSG